MSNKRMSEKQFANIKKRLKKVIEWDCIATYLSDQTEETEFYKKAARDVKRLLKEIDLLKKEVPKKKSGAIVLGPNIK